MEFSHDSFFIRDSEIGSIVATRIVDHSSFLYSSHFGPPSPLSKNHSPSLWESTEVKLGHLNLCILPETNIVTSTPPTPIQIPSLAQDYSSALHTIAAPAIEPPNIVVDDISEDTHLLSNEIQHTYYLTPIGDSILGVSCIHLWALARTSSFTLHSGVLSSMSTPYVFFRLEPH